MQKKQLNQENRLRTGKIKSEPVQLIGTKTNLLTKKTPLIEAGPSEYDNFMKYYSHEVT